MAQRQRGAIHGAFTGGRFLALLMAFAATAAEAQPLQLQPPRPPGSVATPPPSQAAPAVPVPPGVAPAPAAVAQSARPVPLPIPRPPGLGSQAIAPAPAPEVREARPVPPPAAPAPTPAPAAFVQPTPADTSPEAVLRRVNASLNGLSMMQAEFVQTGSNGRRVEGKLYMQKPGRLRFEYKAPAQLEIVADGSSVVIRDRKLGTQDLYGIGQTPLKFLLREKVDLARDTRLVEVNPAADFVTVQIEDKATFGGTSRIELFFDPKSYALKQWTVVDPQGYQTAVSLRNVDTGHQPDPALFLIDYSRNMPNMGGGSGNR